VRRGRQALHEAFGVRSLALGRTPGETAHPAIVAVRAYASFRDPAVVVATHENLVAQLPCRTRAIFATIES
jgi:hypothetical protein